MTTVFDQTNQNVGSQFNAGGKVQENKPAPNKKNTSAWIVGTIFVLYTVLVLGLGSIIGYTSETPRIEEYYRAHYDACVSITHDPVKCKDFVRELQDKDWYNGGESRQWEWPLPETTPAPTPVPTSPGVES